MLHVLDKKNINVWAVIIVIIIDMDIVNNIANQSIIIIGGIQENVVNAIIQVVLDIFN